MMYSQRSKKPTPVERHKNTYSRRPLKQLSVKLMQSKQQFMLEDALDESLGDVLKKPDSRILQEYRSKSKEKRQLKMNLKRSEEEIKSISIDGLEDLSIIRSSQQKLIINNIEKGSVLICDEQVSDEDIPLFDSDIMHESNEECNYSLLQHEYEKLMKISEADESLSLGKVLNISTLSAEKSKREEDTLNRSTRKEAVIEKIDEILRMVHRYQVSKTGETKLEPPNLSVNLSRNSETKRGLNNNLFEINEQWEHSEIMNKEEKKLAKQSSNIIEFTLNQINKNSLDEHSLKKETLVEMEQNEQALNNKKSLAADSIKNGWIAYKTALKNPTLNLVQYYKKLMYESNQVEQEKADEYFSAEQDLKTSKPEDRDNLNKLLSQLVENESDHEESHQNQLKQVPEQPMTKKISELSIEDRKKTYVDSSVLDNMGSISAIKSAGKFRNLSDPDEEDDEPRSPDKQIINRSTQLEDVIQKRKVWVDDCFQKGVRGKEWRDSELMFLAKMKAVFESPTADFE